MGELRGNVNAQVLVAAAREGDLKKALTLLATILSQPIQDEAYIAEYDPTSGKPEKQGWKPYKEWDGKVWESWNWPCFERGDPLYLTLQASIPKGKAKAFRLDDGTFVVVVHVSEQAESAGTIPAYFWFLKAEEG